MTKEGACAEFAEMAARNDNDLEPDWAAALIAAEEYWCLDVKLN